MHRCCSPKNHIFGHFVSIYFRSFCAERAKLNLNVRKLFVLDVDIVFTCSTSNKFFYQTFAQCGPNLVCSEKSRLALSQTQVYLFYKLQVSFRLFGANKL